MSQTGAFKPGRAFPLGRSFVHPLFDYMVIGGGLSLVVVAWVGLDAQASSDGGSASVAIGAFIEPILGRMWGPDVAASLAVLALPTLVLFTNSAHFAASTVRLYTKPGAFNDLPFLTMVFPLITLAALTLSIALAGLVGRHLDALYLTWSPFHYAAQAYGLAVIYCYRSGCQLSYG